MVADKVADMARIAVIGAGMGAMAAAARLAVAGHRVTVYERSATYGGAVGRFEREGFVFDTGPGLLHLPAVWRDLFIKTGKEPLERCVGLVQVDPAGRHLFADGTEVSLPNASRAGVVSALEAALGAGAGERWGAFLGRARDAWDRSRRPLLEEPLRTDWQVLARDPYPAPRQRKLLRTRQASTVAEVGARELADPRLAALLEGYALAYGLDPRHAPAGAALLPYMEQTFGSWYVEGGMRELARAVYERCLARKVEFVFGTEVARIVEKDGRAAESSSSAGRSPGPTMWWQASRPPIWWHMSSGRTKTYGPKGPPAVHSCPAGSPCCWRCAGHGPRPPSTGAWSTHPTPAPRLWPSSAAGRPSGPPSPCCDRTIRVPARTTRTRR